MGGDPVEAGLVTTLSRPGGNVTGTTLMGVELGPKRLELVRQLVPNAVTIAMLVNPNFPLAAAEVRNVQAGARSLGLETDVLNASTESDIDQILNGAKPADLPVWQPTSFLLSVNAKTAKALGLQIPAQILALADELIE